MRTQQHLSNTHSNHNKQSKRSVFRIINHCLITTLVVVSMMLGSYALYQNHLDSFAIIIAMHALFMVWLLLAITDLNYQAYPLYPLLLILLVVDDFPIYLQLSIIAAITLVWLKALKYMLRAIIRL